ncbi:unnamed protein product [Toxocara canis]|uniref:Uncharacterized protein n=1 Tax=Toxocara canis TaxID=6265 RepID=A0A183UX05_TOXCA|nr:unnamed protein product [Toxocara canis]
MECAIRGAPRPRIIISHSVSTDVIREDDPDERGVNGGCSAPAPHQRIGNGLLKTFARYSLSYTSYTSIIPQETDGITYNLKLVL